MFPLRDANPRRSRPLVSYALLVACIAVYAYQALLGHTLRGALFVLRWAFTPATFFQHPAAEAPNLVTNLFLHGGFLHLAGNMLFLVVFADNVEDRMGHGRFLVFYLLGGAVANLGHGALTGDRGLPLIGASGAISAVLGAYIVLFPRQRVLTLIPPLLLPWLVLRLFARVPRVWLPWLPAWLFLGYWALIQLLEASAGGGTGTVATTNVAWWAHLTGFAFGLISVAWFARSSAPAHEGA